MNKYNFNFQLRNLFNEILKIFPLDRCSLEYIYYFDFEKNFKFELTDGKK